MTEERKHMALYDKKSKQKTLLQDSMPARKIKSRCESAYLLSKGKAWIKFSCFVAMMLCFCLLTACRGDSEAGIVVAGSTSVSPFVEVLAEDYMDIERENIVNVQAGGSTAGITAAETGTAHIGMSSRALREEEIDRGFWSREIARDGLAMIVHPDNPIQGLTLEQILGIYTGSITHWNEVGGNDARIHTIAREEGSGTRGAFEELVMGDERVTPRAIVLNSNGTIRNLVASDPNAIGFISLGIADETVVAVKLDGVAPTRENVLNESYTLYRPFLFVAPEEPEGAARQFVDFVMSPQGQQRLINEGLVSLLEGEDVQ